MLRLPQADTEPHPDPSVIIGREIQQAGVDLRRKRLLESKVVISLSSA